MGGICSKGLCCSKGGGGGASDPKNDIGKSSKRSFTLSRRQGAALPESAAVAGNDGITSRSRASKIPVEYTIGHTHLQQPEAEHKQMAAVVVSGHPRRDTVNVGVRHDSKRVDSIQQKEPGLVLDSVPNGLSGEQAAAGWPSWLTSVAAEAINGWLPRKAESFEQLDKIGQGTYSSVYRARDLETGRIVALKKVRFVNMDPESVRFMAREIHILRRLNHPNVIRLEGLVTSKMSGSLYLVFEYMEHDLTGLASLPGTKFTEPQVKCFMNQLLSGLEHCHGMGVLHRDMKGSNLLIGNNGVLKIADFGLATVLNGDEKQQLSSRVVTLWYRSPELLLGATEYGVGVDLWSAGCILAELLARKPIMPGRTEVEQMHKIFKLCGSPSEQFWMDSKLPHATLFKPQHPYKRCLKETFRDSPPSSLSLLDTLLSIEPSSRGTATSALRSEFFTTRPLACDPSSLPKYPPSKEFDAKLRGEEARRQRAATQGQGQSDRGNREAAAGEAAAENRGGRTNLKCTTTSKNDSQEGGGLGIPIGNPATRHHGHGGISAMQGSQKVAPELPSTTSGSTNTRHMTTQRSYLPQGGAVDSANFVGLASAKAAAKSDNYREPVKHHPQWPERRLSNGYNQLDIADGSHHGLNRPASSHKDDIIGAKGTTMGYNAKKNRIHYSGPLMPPGGNIDDMLKEHEKQIQQAVRKARLDKDKTKNLY